MSLIYFQHGWNPTAAMLNPIADAYDAAHTALGDYSLSPGCLKAEFAVFHLVHNQRYLHFSSSGAIVDPGGVFPDVSLSESDTGVGALDLDTVGWLVYGQLYSVTGVSACLEHSEP